MTTKQFKDEVTKVSHYNPSGILVTDFCYNLINEADYSFRFPLFEFLARGSYRYLGPNLLYDGPITWKPMGGDGLLVVGRWEKGRCYLRFDPRVARARRLS